MIAMQKSDKIMQNLVIFYKCSFFSRMIGSRNLAQRYLSTAFRNIRAKIFDFFQYILKFVTKRKKFPKFWTQSTISAGKRETGKFTKSLIFRNFDDVLQYLFRYFDLFLLLILS